MAKKYKYVSWDKKKRRKKAKKVLGLLLVVVILCVGLLHVSHKVFGRRLTGTYANGYNEITFKLNGTWESNLLGSGTYKVKNGYIQFVSDLTKGLFGSDLKASYSFKKGFRKIIIDDDVYVKIKK